MYKQPEHDYRVAVWMDHRTAKIVKPVSREEFEIEFVEAEGHHNEHKAHDNSQTHDKYNDGKNRESVKSFFSDLEKKLSGYDTFLLLGPSTAKSEFEHLMRSSKHFHGKRVAVDNLELLSDNELVAYVKKNLRARMDIYRDEELIK
jgi:stalled ribosome rescue protein Dom34